MKINVIHEGHAKDVLSEHYPDNCLDSLVTDAPYGLGEEPEIVEVMKDWIDHGYHEVKNKGGFMGKEWDAFVPQPITFKEAYRVLKPGAHGLIACGTRTHYWMGSSLRFAGFEIRDVITWHYGTGFPKSVNISKAIDDAAGAEREIIGVLTSGAMQNGNGQNTRPYHEANKNAAGKVEYNITAPATEDAILWDGWGTALKPATEFFILVRKPISEKTIHANVLKWNTGAINIDACRIPFVNDKDKSSATWGRGTDILSGNYVAGSHSKTSGRENIEANDKGRFPSNLIIDQYAAREIDKQAPDAGGSTPAPQGRKGDSKNVFNDFKEKSGGDQYFYNDEGGTSRFFYVVKPSPAERNKGFNKTHLKGEFPNGNDHVTVKPIALMRYLVKLITPKGGICLDMFCGSGTTLIGCKLEHINYVGIDISKRNCLISEIRVSAWNPEKYITQTLF